MRLRFSKYEGLGNDFILVGPEAGQVSTALARKLCDRHFGVGADGVLSAGVREGRPYMRVVNADGSVPEMCGNGLRCVALYLRHTGQVQRERFDVDTDAGPHGCEVRPEGEHGGRVRVAMRPASLDASEVLREGRGEQLDAPFEVDGSPLPMTVVSMGNPHAVLFDELSERADALGPRIERDPRFVNGANVGFARVAGDNALELRVWERGVGWTLACGTGACAAAVAAVVTGRADGSRPVRVQLPGGPLDIEVHDRGAQLRMTGPARRVFEGQTAVTEEDS